MREALTVLKRTRSLSRRLRPSGEASATLDYVLFDRPQWGDQKGLRRSRSAFRAWLRANFSESALASCLSIASRNSRTSWHRAATLYGLA